MHHLRRILGSPGFGVALFLLGGIVFGWPVITIAESHGGAAFFAYLFVAWSVVVALLAVVSSAAGDGRSS